MLFSTCDDAANCGSRQADALKLSDEEMNELCGPSPQLIIATTNTAIDGASHCHAGMRPTTGSATSSMTATPDSKILALRAADGRRGVQERKRVSS